MVLCGSLWFLDILDGSWRFLVVIGGYLWFIVFLVVLCVFLWFRGVLDGFWWFLLGLGYFFVVQSGS